jgi:hypothetical protein
MAGGATTPPRGSAWTLHLARLRERVLAHLAGAGEWWWAPLLYSVAVLWIHRGLWEQHGHVTGLGWDVLGQYGPDLQFQSDELARWAWTQWNPYDRGGYALGADPQFDRYYPASWPFVVVGAITGAPWFAIQLKMLGHMVFAAAMLHLWLRSRGVSASGAVLAGVTLVGAMPLVLHKASLVFLPMVWIPLAWLAIDKLVAAPTWRRGLGLAAALGLVVTAGSPPGIFMAFVVMVPYGVFRLVGALVAARRRGAGELVAYARRFAVPAVIAVAAAAMIAAIVFVPFRELLPLTSRKTHLGAAFALNGPLPGGPSLAGMFAPSHGAIHMYLGLTALVLVFVGLALGAAVDRVTWLLFALGFFGMAMAFGAPWHVMPWLVEHAPGFERLRAPPRYRLVEIWGLAPLVGLGWHALVTGRDIGAGLRRWRRWLPVAIAVAVIVVGAIVIAARAPTWPPPRGRTAVATLVAGVIALAVVAGAMWTPRRWLAAVAAAAAIVIATDATWFVFTPTNPPPAERRPDTRGDAAVLASLGDVEREWRLYDEFLLANRVGVRHRVRDFRGYPAGDQLAQWRYQAILDKARTAPQILEAFNVRWVLSAPHPRIGDGSAYVKLPDKGGHFAKRAGKAWEAEHAAPLVAWYGGVLVAETDRVLDAMLADEDATGARRRAVLEPEELARLGSAGAALASAAAAAPPSVAGTLVDYAADRVVVRVDAPTAGLVVLNEVAYPGWEVTVDGAAATAVRANFYLRGVAVGPGAHVIVWEFRPTHHRVLVALYLLALAGIVVAWPVWPRAIARVRRYARG